MIQQHIKVCHFQLVQVSENMMDTLQLKHATRLSGINAYMWAKSFVNELRVQGLPRGASCVT